MAGALQPGPIDAKAWRMDDRRLPRTRLPADRDRSLRRAPLFVDQQDHQGVGGVGGREKFTIQDLTPILASVVHDLLP